jgi:probable HAF family extracellular repeat protein
MRIRPLLRRCGVVGLLLSLATTVQAATYHLIDLGWRMEDRDLNDHGEVAGTVIFDNHAAVLRNGHWEKLPDHGLKSHAVAINDAGDVAGYVAGKPGFWPRGGAFVKLSLPAGANGGGQVTDISKHQVLIGTHLDAAGVYPVCFQWTAAEGGMDLGTMGDGNYCEASAINDAGMIVGSSNLVEGGPLHAFVYQNGQYHDLGLFDYYDTVGIDINRQGHVTGLSASGTSFLWRGGRLIDISLGSPYPIVNAASINDSDQIVGAAVDASNVWHAVIYEHGHLADLESKVEDLGDWHFSQAISINNLGTILVWAYRTGDQYESSALLVPVGKQ